MREIILFSVAAGLLGGLMPEGRLNDCAQAVLGLIAVRMVAGLISGLTALIP